MLVLTPFISLIEFMLHTRSSCPTTTENEVLEEPAALKLVQIPEEIYVKLLLKLKLPKECLCLSVMFVYLQPAGHPAVLHSLLHPLLGYKK